MMPPVGTISKHPRVSAGPGHQASRAHPRGKPGFSTLKCVAGEETDSLLEGIGFELTVPA
jgi:hypothetical protein